MRKALFFALLVVLPLVSFAQKNLERDVYYLTASPEIRRVGLVRMDGRKVLVKDKAGKQLYDWGEVMACTIENKKYKQVTAFLFAAKRPFVGVMHVLDSGQVTLLTLHIGDTGNRVERYYYFLQQGSSPAMELPHRGMLSGCLS